MERFKLTCIQWFPLGVVWQTDGGVVRGKVVGGGVLETRTGPSSGWTDSSTTHALWIWPVCRDWALLLIFVFCCSKLNSSIGFASESLVNLKNPGPYLIGFGGSCSGRGGREEEREEGRGGEGGDCQKGSRCVHCKASVGNTCPIEMPSGEMVPECGGCQKL